MVAIFIFDANHQYQVTIRNFHLTIGKTKFTTEPGLHSGLPSFGGSLLSGFISGHKVLTLVSGVVTFGSLRY